MIAVTDRLVDQLGESGFLPVDQRPKRNGIEIVGSLDHAHAGFEFSEGIGHAGIVSNISSICQSN